jgi:hypothetical protein
MTSGTKRLNIAVLQQPSMPHHKSGQTKTRISLLELGVGNFILNLVLAMEM